MRKFKGQINGVEYTNQESFREAYERLTASGTHEPINVSYSIEYIDDSCDKKNPIGKVENKIDNNQIPEKLTEDDSKILCEAVEKIRDIVDDTTSRIQSYIDSDTQTYRSMREFCVMTDAAISKIRWIVQSLPAKLRKELCTNIYNATKEMVDNINSELVDIRYELSKRQESIGGEVNEIEKDIKDVDNEIEELQNEKDSLFDEIGELQTEYDRNGSKVEAISTATRFFDDLVESFSL